MNKDLCYQTRCSSTMHGGFAIRDLASLDAHLTIREDTTTQSRIFIAALIFRAHMLMDHNI